MLDAAGKATAITANLNRSEFEHDEISVLAVTRLLEILGEAARRVSPGLKSGHPEIEWKGITGARDRLIHGYDAVDLDIVWNICTEDLPLLIDQLNSLLASHPDVMDDPGGEAGP
jgi:uncharacterized protein with HEPN domain